MFIVISSDVRIVTPAAMDRIRQVLATNVCALINERVSRIGQGVDL